MPRAKGFSIAVILTLALGIGAENVAFSVPEIQDLRSRVEVMGLRPVMGGLNAGNFGPGFQFSVEGRAKGNGEDDRRAKFRSVSPGFFAALGSPRVNRRSAIERSAIGLIRS